MIISIEGINGCGKTTQVELVTNKINDSLHDVKARSYVDPGVIKGHAAHSKIRPLARFGAWNSPMTRMMLYMAARCELFDSIRKSIRACEWVVLDRYIASFYVYGHKAFKKPEDITALLEMCGAVTPDLTFLVMVDPEVAKARYDRVSSGRYDVYEKDGVAKMKELNSLYRAIADNPKRCPFVGTDVVVVPEDVSNRSAVEVCDFIWDRIVQSGGV